MFNVGVMEFNCKFSWSFLEVVKSMSSNSVSGVKHILILV